LLLFTSRPGKSCSCVLAARLESRPASRPVLRILLLLVFWRVHLAIVGCPVFLLSPCLSSVVVPGSGRVAASRGCLHPYFLSHPDDGKSCCGCITPGPSTHCWAVSAEFSGCGELPLFCCFPLVSWNPSSTVVDVGWGRCWPSLVVDRRC